jgi:hypothetical protein
MTFDAKSGRALLQLPEGYTIPESDFIVQDARAILLHMVNLRKDNAGTNVDIAPIWENLDGQAGLRAAVVPPEVVKRHFEGAGFASLKESSVLVMIGDLVEMLAEDPAAAAAALAPTESLWISGDAPARSLQMPYKGHYKLLTLVIADLCRKVGAGFTELEWIASLGVLDAFHDPANDPPIEAVRASMQEKLAKLADEEAKWMSELASSAN